MISITISVFNGVEVTLNAVLFNLIVLFLFGKNSELTYVSVCIAHTSLHA